MLSAETIARIKALDLRGRHMATDLMSGDYASAFHGRGMEFHEVREYVPGDDVRGIDWNVTARMNQPFIKVFREERELTVMLLVDISASLASGLSRSRKDASAELAAVIAWLAIRGNDRVGLMLFGQSVELYVPPRKGQGHVWRIIRDVMTWTQQGKASNIDSALDQVAKVVINERTGTVVSGGDVRISDVTISHGEIRVIISTDYQVSQPNLGEVNIGGTAPGVRTVVVPDTDIDVREGIAQAVDLPAGTSISDLVTALRQIKTSTRDVITILQGIKRAGALHAQLIIQ